MANLNERIQELQARAFAARALAELSDDGTANSLIGYAAGLEAVVGAIKDNSAVENGAEMNPAPIDYSEKVVMAKEGDATEMSLSDAIQTFMQLRTLHDRLACTIMRDSAPMQYAEMVRIAWRKDFPRTP